VYHLSVAKGKPILFYKPPCDAAFWCEADPAALDGHYRALLTAVPYFLCLDLGPPSAAAGDAVPPLLLDPGAEQTYRMDAKRYLSHWREILKKMAECREKHEPSKKSLSKRPPASYIVSPA
jgi:hypothetical protein